ncbi:DUF3757 domain-containing protein [Pseudomonas asplenii]|uniref:DUF3757 domain-containing protein n=1 Tax=Pseudomonas asplenii TaxID=53407 RepID=UPI00036848CA|nr:DUF3757 domain-containing protein [Pseudomonas fuscovaginae]
MRNRLANRLALLTLALASQAYAADPVQTATCPAREQISQSEMAGGGFSYQASGPGGSSWTGENEEAKGDYLQQVAFISATYKESTKAVICDYEGPGDAGIRLVLKAFEGWQPGQGTDWPGNTCQNSVVGQCAFAYSKLAAPAG